jgi:hypothetical protein
MFEFFGGVDDFEGVFEKPILKHHEQYPVSISLNET